MRALAPALLPALLATAALAAACGSGGGDADPCSGAACADATDDSGATDDAGGEDAAPGDDAAPGEDTGPAVTPRPYPAPDAHAANRGPGGPAVTFPPEALYQTCAYLDGGAGDVTDHHNLLVMYDGLLLMPWAPESGVGGFTFWDFSDPCAPAVEGYGTSDLMRETHSIGFSHVGGAWAVVDGYRPIFEWIDGQLVPDETGILFWDLRDTAAPEPVHFMALPGSFYGFDAYERVTLSVFWQAPYVYVAGADNGVYVVDATDPTAPELVAQVPFNPTLRAGQIHAIGDLLIVTEAGGPRTALLDISDPARPQPIPGGDFRIHDSGPNFAFDGAEVDPPLLGGDGAPLGAAAPARLAGALAGPAVLAGEHVAKPADRVTVAAVMAPAAGFVVVHEASGAPIGHAAVPAGLSERVTVPLAREVADGEALVARLHGDDGDGAFDPALDAPVAGPDDGPAEAAFTVRREEALTSPALVTGVLATGDPAVLRVPAVLVDDLAWLAVHADDAGAPGALLGSTLALGGLSRDVLVTLSRPVADGEPLHVRLLDDAGGVPREAYFSNVGGGYAWYARKDNGGGLIVYDISDPTRPTFAGDYRSDGDGGYVFVKDDLAFVGESQFATIYDVSDPAGIHEVTRLDLHGDLDTLVPIGNMAVLSVDADADPDKGTSVAPYELAPDTRPPQVTWVYPPDGAETLAPTSRIGLTFSEMVDVKSAWEGSVRLYVTGTDPALTRVDGWVSAQENVVNFWPASPLDPGTSYTLELPAGGVADYNGNRLAAPFTATFRTAGP